jgi:putative tryptophan/tyrosine transport system substrate-binding protein
MSRPTAVALVLFAILAAATLRVGAETPGKVYRIALLATHLLPGGEALPPPAVAELARYGFVEGRNLRLEPHLGEQLADLAGELVATHPDVILAGGLLAARTVHGATQTIPIIAIAGYFVESGLVANLAHPGGNLSGVSLPELDLRGLELLRELMPTAHRVTLLRDPQSGPVELVAALEAAAHGLGIDVAVVEVRRPEEIAKALSQARSAGANFRYAPFTTEVVWRCNTSLWANGRRSHRGLHRRKIPQSPQVTSGQSRQSVRRFS